MTFASALSPLLRRTSTIRVSRWQPLSQSMRSLTQTNLNLSRDWFPFSTRAETNHTASPPQSPPLPIHEISSYDFLTRAQKARVSKIGFLRHGNTSPKPEGGVDFDRLLTRKGQDQARTAGTSFGRGLQPFYPKILASPAPRTMETAQLFLEGSSQVSDDNDSNNNNSNNNYNAERKLTQSLSYTASAIDIVPIPALYDGTMQPQGCALFQRIGYAPLHDYVNNSSEQVRQSARQVLGNYSQVSLQCIYDALEPLVTTDDDNNDKDEEEDVLADSQQTTTLWVVGHAVYLPAAALGVASLAQCDEASLDVILSSDTLEAEGYLVDLERGTARYLPRDKSRDLLFIACYW